RKQRSGNQRDDGNVDTDHDILIHDNLRRQDGGARGHCAAGGLTVALRKSTAFSMNLHAAGYRRGVVCAPHSAAVEDGRAILAEGGNAIEAMLAMAASIAAVYPHMNH